MLFIGVDLGTSSVKTVLSDEKGNILSTVSKEYPCEYPHNGWSEQNPEDWYKQTIHAVLELIHTKDVDPIDVAGISFGGQMHGLVILDENDQVIRPAILWNDGRSEDEVHYLNETIGKSKLSEYCGNIAFAGFTAPKLLWVKNNEPENFKKIRKIMLPKDYLAYKLSGTFCTDVSDASGTLLFDVKNRKWSKKMLDICELKMEQLPQVFESYEVVGTLNKEHAELLNLSENVKVVAGAGDNEAAAVGTRCVKQGQCNVSIGTSGTVFMPLNQFNVDPHNALHSFADATGKNHLMGCMLSAASCNKWWMENVLETSDFTLEQENMCGLGENTIYFLPYLMGERSPINDAEARGAFIGLSLDTTRKQMTQSIFEGVAFALRDSFEVAKELNIDINQVTICGGGAKSVVWKKIIANILQKPINVLEKEEGPGYGACILAMVGCGVYKNVDEASLDLNKIKETIKPDLEVMELYNEKYDVFKMLYPSLRDVYKKMKEVNR